MYDNNRLWKIFSLVWPNNLEQIPQDLSKNTSKNFQIFWDPLKLWDTVDSKLWIATLCEFLSMPNIYDVFYLMLVKNGL